MSFSIFYIKKTPLQPIKTKSSKSRKTDIFQEGLTHSFGPKLAIFPTFFFSQYRQGKCLLRYSRTKKKAFLGYKNIKFKKSKNWHFSKGLTHGFGPKMDNLPTFFLRNIGQENVFFDILERKNAFLGYKNKKFKKSKNWHFSKGVNPCFGLQMAVFPTFIF